MPYNYFPQPTTPWQTLQNQLAPFQAPPHPQSSQYQNSPYSPQFAPVPPPFQGGGFAPPPFQPPTRQPPVTGWQQPIPMPTMAPPQSQPFQPRQSLPQYGPGSITGPPQYGQIGNPMLVQSGGQFAPGQAPKKPGIYPAGKRPNYASQSGKPGGQHGGYPSPQFGQMEAAMKRPFQNGFVGGSGRPNPVPMLAGGGGPGSSYAPWLTGKGIGNFDAGGPGWRGQPNPPSIHSMPYGGYGSPGFSPGFSPGMMPPPQQAPQFQLHQLPASPYMGIRRY